MKKFVNRKYIFKEAGVLLVAAILVLTALVMVPTTVADSSDILLEESSWPNPYPDVPATGWTDEHKTIASNYGWKQSLTSYSGGSSPEAYIYYYYCLPNYVFYSYDFSTEGYSNCVLEFKSYINHYSGEGLYSLHAGWSTDALIWHEVWSAIPNTNTQYFVSAPLPNEAENQPMVYIGFWVEVNPYYMNYWCIDDVVVYELDVLDAYVDIKPGGWPNPINTKDKGVLPVAICGTEDFDVSNIDPATIKICIEGIEEGVSPIRWSYEDVATPWTGDDGGGHDLGGDGYLDLCLKFSNQEVVTILGLGSHIKETISLFIIGNLKEEYGGTPFKGHDWAYIIK